MKILTLKESYGFVSDMHLTSDELLKQSLLLVYLAHFTDKM